MAAAAIVVVGLLWAVVVSLAPGRHPWPVGSADGSVWNAIFVFNGFGKVGAAVPGHTGGPGVLRLLQASGWHYDLLFGCALMASLALGATAVLAGASGAPRRLRVRLRRGDGALAVATGVWLVLGIAVFDVIRTVHARYLDAVAPAVALAIGCGAAALAGLYGRPGSPAPLGRPRMVAIAAAVVAITVYTLRFKPANVGLSAVMLCFAAAGAVLLTRAGPGLDRPGRWLLAGLLTAIAVVFPAHESLRLIRSHSDDSGGLATLDSGSVAALSAYLGPRTTGLRYELAVDEPLSLAALVVRDGRPLLALTSFAARPLTGVDELLRDVATGEVRYALIGSGRCPAKVAACAPAARWIRQTAVRVPVPGLARSEHLYRLKRLA